ncbi:ABC transporter permease [Spirosoma endophyticum]|uniref:Duplicated orphan permease n=1 Tax=Spirosoma endophyticum TaxID=662367 RepID=A0A1I1VDG5_9BACT|nr:ABC transporter permease [Spirosoma endophyticum]SFD80974.1 duplicated orphan permease [Spirosoma endophyticum]
MLTNYLKIAWRSLLRNRLLSLINIAGLSLGLACSLVIGLWVADELNFNKGYTDADRIYFVRLTDGTNTGEIMPGPLAEALKKDVPEVDKATRFTVWSNDFLLKAGQRFTKKVGIYATEDFFDIFQYPVLQGNPRTAIQSPNAIIITRTVAQTFFRTVDAVGRTLQLNNDKYYQVGAVIENVPRNSSVQFDWLVNFKVAEEDWMKGWGSNSFLTYIKLKPNTTQTQAEASMKGLMKRYRPESAEFPVLQPIGDTYLYGNYANGKPVGGRISYVHTFSLVSLLILLIACVNFTNLATARSSLRAKEVGIRKVVGAGRLALAGQFMGESILLNALSAALAVGLVVISLPTVNQMVDKQLFIDFTAPGVWLGLLVLVITTSLVAGAYPALFLSAMQPVRVLKGVLGSAPAGAFFRKSLVVFQFSLSLFLIVGMLIIGRQMNYVRTKQLGLNREDLLHVPVEGELRPKLETFRQELQRSNTIQSVTTAGELPIQIGSTGGLNWAGKDPKLDGTVSTMKVGLDFTRTLGVHLVDGRDFKAADTSNYIVNESTVRMMKLKNPVGAEVDFQRGKGRIIGVMQDFHISSFHAPIRPLVLSYYPKWTNYFLIKTRPGQTDKAIQVIEQTAKKLNPGYPFTYHFVNEEYEKLYRSETLVNTLINYFGLLAILISCLGLFGLATFTAEQRTKEIGVRKVLGASVVSIVSLLSKDFLKLVLVAIVIASPLAWYSMQQWLQNFAYKIDIEWWVFALSGMLAVGIALLTVSFQSVKAALMNPVKSLRSE